jgi:hypothetical protein
MSTFTLIILILVSDKPVAMTSIPGYTTVVACQEAATAVRGVVINKYTATDADTHCIRVY